MGIGVDLEQRLQEQTGSRTLLWIGAGRQSCALRAQPLHRAGQFDPMQRQFPLGHLSARDKREPRKVEGSVFCLVRLGNGLAFPNKWSLAWHPGVWVDNAVCLVLICIVLHMLMKPHWVSPASQELDIFTLQMSTLLRGINSQWLVFDPDCLEPVG